MVLASSGSAIALNGALDRSATSRLHHPGLAGLPPDGGTQDQPRLGLAVGVGGLLLRNHDAGAGTRRAELERHCGPRDWAAPGVGYLDHQRVVERLTHPALLVVPPEHRYCRRLTLVGKHDPVPPAARGKQEQSHGWVEDLTGGHTLSAGEQNRDFRRELELRQRGLRTVSSLEDAGVASDQLILSKRPRGRGPRPVTQNLFA